MKGYDSFFEKPGQVEEKFCQVCGAQCLVKRNEVGPTSYMQAMARAQTVHDYFYCPNMKQEWHDQAMDLVEEIENTHSKRVAELVWLDLKELLSQHGCSLE